MNEGMLKFICAITGHDDGTIKQMYRDWQSSPNIIANPLDCVVSLQKDAIKQLYSELAIEFLNEAKKHNGMLCKDFRELPEAKEIKLLMDYIEKKYPEVEAIKDNLLSN